MDDQAASTSTTTGSASSFPVEIAASATAPIEQRAVEAAVNEKEEPPPSPAVNQVQRSSLYRGSSNPRSSVRATTATTGSMSAVNSSKSSSGMDKSEPGTVARVEGEGSVKYEAMKRQSASHAGTSTSTTSTDREAPISAGRRATVTAASGGSSLMSGPTPAINRRASSEPTAVILAQGGTMPFVHRDGPPPPPPSPTKTPIKTPTKTTLQEEADAALKSGLKQSRAAARASVSQGTLNSSLPGVQSMPPKSRASISTTYSSNSNGGMHSSAVEADARIKAGLRNSRLSTTGNSSQVGASFVPTPAALAINSNSTNTPPRQSRRNTTQAIPRASIIDADTRKKHGLRNHSSSSTTSSSPGATSVTHRGPVMMDDSSHTNHTSRASVASRNSMIDADTRAKYGLRNSMPPSTMDDGSHNSHHRQQRGSVLSRGSPMDDSSRNSHRGSVASSRNSMVDADTRMKYGLRNSMAPGTPVRATNSNNSGSVYITPDRSVASFANSEGSALCDFDEGYDPSARLFGDPETKSSDKNEDPLVAVESQQEVAHDRGVAVAVHMSPNCTTESGNLRPGAYRGAVTESGHNFSLERTQSLEKGGIAMVGRGAPLDPLRESYSNKEYQGELMEAAAIAVPQLAPQTTANDSQRIANSSSRHGAQQDESTGASRKSIFWLKHFWWIALLIIFALIGIIVGVVFGTSGSRSSDGSEFPSESIDAQSTSSGLPVPLSTLFPTTVLANSTVEAIESGGRVPQYLAYQWLVGDPALDAYTEEQLLQRFALASLYYSTDGPNWFPEDTGAIFLEYETHECSWFNTGVEQCAGYDRSDYLSDELRDHYPYSSLVLSGDTRMGDIPQIRGKLAPELSLLTSLETLDIGLQSLRGSIPAELSALSKLETLVLYGNYLSGVIPPSLFASPPKTMWLSHNDFDKQVIPSTIGADLTSFYCINCNLEGTIPAELFRLTSLQELRLGENDLTGTVDTRIGDLTRLETLLLSMNRLTGNLPSELGRLAALKDFQIQSNKIEGALPTELGQLTELLYFDVAGNKLEGSLITELGQLSNLRELKLSKKTLLQALTNTGLSGEIPSSYLLGSSDGGTNITKSPAFPFLTHLWIEGTAVSGTVPTELALLTPLQGLRLGRNKFTEGGLPNLVQLTNLEELTFSFNDRLPERAIPSELGLLTRLTNLGLAGSNFHSSIPSELGLLSDLQYLKLQANTLTAEIPEEVMAVAETLDQLRIDENKGNLSGTFPSGVCGIEDLQLGCSDDENSKLCGCGCPCE